MEGERAKSQEMLSAKSTWSAKPLKFLQFHHRSAGQAPLSGSSRVVEASPKLLNIVPEDSQIFEDIFLKITQEFFKAELPLGSSLQ